MGKKHNKMPGTGDNWQEDGDELKTMAAELLTKLGLQGREIEENCLLEIARFGGCEPHTTGAFFGRSCGSSSAEDFTSPVLPIQSHHDLRWCVLPDEMLQVL